MEVSARDGRDRGRAGRGSGGAWPQELWYLREDGRRGSSGARGGGRGARARARAQSCGQALAGPPPEALQPEAEPGLQAAEALLPGPEPGLQAAEALQQEAL